MTQLTIVLLRGNVCSLFLICSDTNWPAQLQKLAKCLNFHIEPRSEKTGLRGFRPGLTQTGLYSNRRGLNFLIYVVDGLYYPYSQNKGADQLRGYREADLHLCFRICKKPVFSQRGSY